MNKHIIIVVIVLACISIPAFSQDALNYGIHIEKTKILSGVSLNESNMSDFQRNYQTSAADTSVEEYQRLLGNLQTGISNLKSMVAGNELNFAAGSLKIARQRISEIKNKYPGANLSSYETEINGLDKAINSKVEKTVSKEEAIRTIRKLVYECDRVIPYSWGGRMYTQFKSDAERFYNECIASDYPGTKSKLDALLSQHPDLKKNPEIRDDIDNFYNKLIPRFSPFADFLIKSANESMENAYAALQRKDMVAANDNAEISTMLTKCVLSYMPDHTAGKKMILDNEKLSAKLDGAMGNVYSSAYHKTNAGKIILSKSPVIPKQETANTSSTGFTLKDYIYGMVYLKGTVKELSDGAAVAQTTMVITIFIDGNEMGSCEFPMSQKMQQSTYIPIEILPDPATAMDCAGSVKYATILSQCSPREHEVKFRFSTIYLSQRRDLATGTVQIDCSDGQGGLGNTIAAYHKRALKNVFMPKAAMNNPALEADMIAATKVMLSRRGLQGLPVKAVIVEDAWTIYRHPLTGAIIERKINGAVSVKKPNGDCVLYGQTFSQSYVGGKYGKTQPSATDDGTQINCVNAGNR